MADKRKFYLNFLYYSEINDIKISSVVSALSSVHAGTVRLLCLCNSVHPEDKHECGYCVHDQQHSTQFAK